MSNFNLSRLKGNLLMLLIIFPVYTFAGEGNYVSKLNNTTNGVDLNKYYLVKDKIWSTDECVADSGKERINPGESTTLEIKKGCTWGGVSYKIFKMTDNQDLGVLSHSFRDGSFKIEISMSCSATGCNFYDLSPQQQRKDDKKAKN